MPIYYTPLNNISAKFIVLNGTQQIFEKFRIKAKTKVNTADRERRDRGHGLPATPFAQTRTSRSYNAWFNV